MRLIDADALPLILVPSYMSEDIRGVLELIQKAIDEAPTIDAEPVRYGRWIDAVEDWRYRTKWYRCLQCHFESSTAYKYCPNCGAKMEIINDETY